MLKNYQKLAKFLNTINKINKSNIRLNFKIESATTTQESVAVTIGMTAIADSNQLTRLLLSMEANMNKKPTIICYPNSKVSMILLNLAKNRCE